MKKYPYILSVVTLIVILGMSTPIKADQKIYAVYSPSGGCVPGGTICSPCDPGLGYPYHRSPGSSDCIPSDDWHPSCHIGCSRGTTSHSHGEANVPTQGGVVEPSKNPTTNNNQHDGNINNNDANSNKKSGTEKGSN
jgi:hypothetical protein